MCNCSKYLYINAGMLVSHVSKHMCHISVNFQVIFLKLLDNEKIVLLIVKSTPRILLTVISLVLMTWITCR